MSNSLSNESPADRIEQIASTQGSTEAYQALYQDFQQASSTMPADELSQYWQGYTSDLQHRRILPALAVNWLNDNFDQVDSINHNGTVDRSELKAVSDPFGRVFASEFLEVHKKHDFFRTVANLPGAEGGGINEIEQEDLGQYIHKDDRRVRREGKQEDQREAMRPLMEGDDPLIDALNSGRNPKRITRREMKDFIKQCEAFDRQNLSQEERGPFTQANADYVEALMKGEMKEINRHGGVSIDKLARKGGFDNSDGVSVNYQLSDEHPNQKNAETRDFAPPSEEPHPSEFEGIEVEPTRNERFEHLSPEALSPRELMNSSTVRPGEGYSHVAARLLDIDVSRGWKNVSSEDQQKVLRLTGQLAMIHGGTDDLPGSTIKSNRGQRPLYSGDVLLNRDAFAWLFENNPDFKDKFRTER
ncbi:MAG: hypothetical protein K8F91_11355 [Candidatus Obscuribacterales bacterium]|nr:hypothetical protein [Candidatus Obscuribacterales bacterium]